MRPRAVRFIWLDSRSLLVAAAIVMGLLFASQYQSIATEPLPNEPLPTVSQPAETQPAEAQPNGAPAKAVDFRTEVRPILSNRCFACHGPDENKIESGLRLDQFSSATAPADSGEVAVVPNDSKKSEVMRRILSSDESVRMPPPHFGAKLTDREADILQRWIDQGAKYAKHWSYEPIIAPQLPQLPAELTVKFPNWTRGPIDSLVLGKLHEKNWEPSIEASKLTLLRRATLDITGLPPTLEQQRSFLADESPFAYERLIDSLLASPAYGEHWGRKWLDLARYADSAGYADDPARTIWAYRDWVVRSFNSGMPFDEFTIDQLAGDLRPNPTDDQLIATAFHRNTLTNNEGGTNDEEFRNVAIVDRVNTTMAVWMGVTMACAQCHSHKYDPISQKEYFQVFAILNQTEDADRGDESPIHPWFTPEQREDQKITKEKLLEAESALYAPAPEMLAAQRQWESEMREPIVWNEPIAPVKLRSQSGTAIQYLDSGIIQSDSNTDNDTFTVEIPISSPLAPESLTGIQITSEPIASLPNGGAGHGDGNFVLTNVAASFVGSAPISVPSRFVRIEMPGEQKILSLAEVQVMSDGRNVATSGTASQSTTDFGGDAARAIDGNTSGVYAENSTTHSAISKAPWWEVDLKQSFAVEKLVLWNRTDATTGERLGGAVVKLLAEDRSVIWESKVNEKPGASTEFEIYRSITVPLLAAMADYSQDGFAAQNAIDTDTKSGWAVGGQIAARHQLGLAIDSDELRKKLIGSSSESLVLRVTLDHRSQHKQATLGRFSVRLTTDSRCLPLHRLPTNIVSLIRKPLSERAETDEVTLHKYYVSNAAERRGVRDLRDSLEKHLASIKPMSTVPILRELKKDKQRITNIQIRGNYKVHGEQVQPGVPTAFHSWKPTERLASVDKSSEPLMDRMEFARWLMDRENPLTARVIANRYWENLFGVGIVRTSEEFGSQGDLPANPELLDYLASSLIKSGWDTKRFIREIVTSETYKQRSYVTPERYEQDPENVFHSRGPRFRVSAEQVRDMALESAGLLGHRMFGPPTRPPQPSLGLSAAFGSGTDWETSKGEDRFRRAIYTLWRRSNPYPSMATFDAPNREVCVLKRDRTNTPLQALVTMNDPAFVEAAQGLARRVVLMELPNASFEEQIQRVFEHALTRQPSIAETQTLKQLFSDAVNDLRGDMARATKLATEPIGKLPDDADPVVIAAWTAISNVVLNLDEFLMTP